MKKTFLIITASILIGYGAANIQTVSAVKPVDVGYATAASFSINPLTAPGESGYTFASQINKNGNTGNITFLVDHRNDVNIQACQVSMTPAEFEAFRLFVAQGF